MLRQALWCVLSWGLLLGLSMAAPDPNQPIPSPEQVQARVWKNMKLKDFYLEGLLRTKKQDHKLIMRTKGRTLVYEFPERKFKVRVDMTAAGSEVKVKLGEKDWEVVKGKDRQRKILGTDLTYEDAGIDFLRWGDIRPLGSDNIKTFKTWAYSAKPTEESIYDKAHFWISADHFAVMKVEAYSDDKLAKRLEVWAVKRVEGAYVIGEMKISSHSGREKSDSITWVEIRDARPGSGL